MIHDRPRLIRYNERGATEPYDPCEVFPPELTESNRKMARERARLPPHIRQFGADGRFTFHAGITVEEAAAPGMVEAVKRSTLHEFKEGDTVFIRGTDIACPVEQVLGMFLILTWPPVTAKSFRELPVRKKGKYVYGRVKIYKAHVEPVGGFL